MKDKNQVRLSIADIPKELARNGEVRRKEREAAATRFAKIVDVLALLLAVAGLIALKYFHK